jgi:MFS transporter, AAHS family, 4-hydroxybenzoate transporter
MASIMNHAPPDAVSKNPAAENHVAQRSSALVTDSGTIQWRIIIVCFLVIFFDGFDTTSIGFVVPTLAQEWGMPATVFTSAFVATSLGAVIGYMISGPLRWRLGSRCLIFCSVLLFAAGSMITALAGSLQILAMLRLLTGIGLGAALPAAVALASTQCPARHREVIAVAVTAGIGLGSTFGGLIGGHLIAWYGWQSVFLLGALLPALLLPFIWRLLPAQEPRPDQPAADPASRSDAGIGSLFQGTLALRTALLWSFSFLIFITVYALYFWLPTLLLSFGFSANETPKGIAFLGTGGLVGAILLIPLSTRFGVARVLVFTSLLGAAAIAGVAAADLGQHQVLFGIAVIGAGLMAGTVGQIALAVTLYPVSGRATGIGCSAAVGRIGSILGPAVGGLLLALGKPPRDIVLTACIPILIAVLMIAALDFYQRRQA